MGLLMTQPSRSHSDLPPGSVLQASQDDPPKFKRRGLAPTSQHKEWASLVEYWGQDRQPLGTVCSSQTDSLLDPQELGRSRSSRATSGLRVQFFLRVRNPSWEVKRLTRGHPAREMRSGGRSPRCPFPGEAGREHRG